MYSVQSALSEKWTFKFTSKSALISSSLIPILWALANPSHNIQRTVEYTSTLATHVSAQLNTVSVSTAQDQICPPPLPLLLLLVLPLWETHCDWDISINASDTKANQYLSSSWSLSWGWSRRWQRWWQRKEGGGFGHQCTICLIGVKGRSSDRVTCHHHNHHHNHCHYMMMIIIILVTSIMTWETGGWAYFKVPNARIYKSFAWHQ